MLKKLFYSLITLVSLVGIAWAVSTQLSSLSAVTSVAGTDLWYDVQTPGAGGLKATVTQLATYLHTLTSGDCTQVSGGAITCTKTSGSSFGTSATVNTGTSGATIPLLNGSNTWSGVQTFGEVLGTVTSQSGTTYTLASTDCGTEVTFTNAAAITVTIPATLPIGCNISILQTTAAGQVTVTGSAVTAATLHSAHSYTKTFGQWAIIGINIEANSGGSSAIAILTGDGA